MGLIDRKKEGMHAIKGALTRGVVATSSVAGEFVAVVFFNSKHANLPASLVLLWQHVSIVQNPAYSVLYYLDNEQIEDIY